MGYPTKKIRLQGLKNLSYYEGYPCIKIIIQSLNRNILSTNKVDVIKIFPMKGSPPFLCHHSFFLFYQWFFFISNHLTNSREKSEELGSERKFWGVSSLGLDILLTFLKYIYIYWSPKIPVHKLPTVQFTYCLYLCGSNYTCKIKTNSSPQVAHSTIYTLFVPLWLKLNLQD